MLIRITNFCTMGCRHCMVDASEKGKHMPLSIFEDVLEFVKDSFIHALLLSGGEPSAHPDLLKIIDLANQSFEVVLLSNGEFLNEDPALRDAVLARVHSIQVTNDPLFYPRHVYEYVHPKVTWVKELTHVSPHGRARGGVFDVKKKYPQCFNMRSLSRSMSFESARACLALRGYMCTPSVNIDGTVSAGESPFCSLIGNIHSSQEELTEALCNLRCERCGLTDNLTREQRAAIGLCNAEVS